MKLHALVISNDGESARMQLSDGTPIELFRGDKPREQFLENFPPGDVARGTFEILGALSSLEN